MPIRSLLWNDSHYEEIWNDYGAGSIIVIAGILRYELQIVGNKI
jgi:hypothetical protein